MVSFSCVGQTALVIGQLLEEGEIPSLRLSDNALFCTAVQNWFRMNNMLDPKRTYVMEEIEKKSPELHRMIAHYLTDHEPAAKHAKLREIVHHIEKPFGGPLPSEWAFPAGSTAPKM